MTEEEHLSQLRDDVERATEKTRELTEGLTDEQLLWKPGPKKWSIAECLEHLILGEAWYDNIEKAMQDGDPVPSSEERQYRPTWFGRFILGMTGKKVKTPLSTHPMFEPGDEVQADAPERFVEQQQRLLQLIEDARGFDLRAERVALPPLPLVRIRLGEAFALVVNHQHRHLQQAEDVMQNDAFPATIAEKK